MVLYQLGSIVIENSQCSNQGDKSLDLQSGESDTDEMLQNATCLIKPHTQ